MFEIAPRALSELQLQLAPFAEYFPPECREQLTSSHACDDQTNGPFVQLGYDEIAEQEIDRILGYADIPAANAAIGVDGDFPPIRLGDDARTQVLIFSLSRFEEHLASQEPSIAQLLRDTGSMDAFVRERGNAMTAIEYLTGGVLACIWFCREKKQALVITW